MRRGMFTHPIPGDWPGHRGGFGPMGHGHPPFGPPDFLFFGGGRGRGRGRRSRGNVRAAILALLAERPMHGYEMIQELETRTGGVWRPSPGSIYPTLQLLEEEGLIAGEDVDGRRRFALTDAGRPEAERHAGATLYQRCRDTQPIAALTGSTLSSVHASAPRHTAESRQGADGPARGGGTPAPPPGDTAAAGTE